MNAPLPRTVDVEFPHHLIRGVTLAEYRRHDWEYVVATVQENQHGLARLARESGARYVYQVGNTGQRVDWDLEPLALVSAEAPIPEGYERACRYHQEFDKDVTFRFREPDAAALSKPLAASYVNCFDRMPREWERFGKIRAALPELRFEVHGHDGADGLIQPTEAVADRMATATFGYHDKPQGDGFGHVIHYWAAVGRPLIGTAGYYDGRMARPLWEDGVTAVFLDGKEPAQVAAEVLAILRDPQRYDVMCRTIRARLDALADFDREEREIRRVLGLDAV